MAEDKLTPEEIKELVTDGVWSEIEDEIGG